MKAAFKQELSGLIDLVHGGIGTPGAGDAPTRRVVLDLPEGWRLLAAWLEMRRRMELGGQRGNSPLPVNQLSDRIVQHLARTYIGNLLDEHFHLELHDLATGGHRYGLNPRKRPFNETSAQKSGDAQ